MTDRDWSAMSEQDFDNTLKNSLPGPPPAELAGAVNPWQTAWNRVLWGMALTSITLNFWCLNYILPTAGILLSLLGFRALRRENRWLGACFAITVFRVILNFPVLILGTTIWRSIYAASPVQSILTAGNVILQLILFFCLWRGLRSVQEAAGLPPHARAAGGLLAWYIIMCLLAAVQYVGLIIPLAMLILYLLMLRSLCKLSNELKEAGYAIRAAAARVSDRVLVLFLLAILAVGCVCGYAFGTRYPMDWQPVAQEEHASVTDVKAHLLALGFPEDVLDDLSEEDIAACAGAVEVVSETDDRPMNNDRQTVTTQYDGEGRETRVMETVYDVNELRLTHVAVRLPGKPEQWRIFHHFLWTVEPNFRGTEAIQFWPAYQNSDGWKAAGPVTGRVLCDRDGQTYFASYAYLGSQTYTSDSIFWGEQTSTDLFAAFSLPRQGEQFRGYVAYSIAEMEPEHLITSWLNYTHQQFFRYPAMTAMEQQRSGIRSSSGFFRTVQSALQFYPFTEEAAAERALS